MRHPRVREVVPGLMSGQPCPGAAERFGTRACSGPWPWVRPRVVRLADPTALNGPLAQWVDELSELADSYGFDTFILWNDDPTQLDRFAHEVVPALRSGVG